MTVYTDRETSGHDGEPIECYEFVGSYKTYRYTSGDLAVTVNGNVFEPALLKRTNVKVGTHSEDNIDLNIEMPVSLAMAKDNAFQLTPPRLRLTVYRVHRGTNYATDFSIYWIGNTYKWDVDGESCTVNIPSVFSAALAGNVPSIFYQAPCNHVLFDSGCKISRAANKVTTTVTGITGSVVQVATIGAFVSGDFIGGEVADIAHNDRKMIVLHAGNVLTVNYPFSTLQIGATVEVTRGCDHAFEGHCKTRYANQINFGGFPFVPSINPFESGL